MNQNPLVSVIMPVYNDADYILQAVNSIFDQNYSNIEVIIIDDGSSDNTLAVLAPLKDRLIILQQDNAGSAEARNNGMRKATGQYIAFLDSDDLWFPEKLELQVAYLEQHPHVGIVYNRWLEWKSDADGLFCEPNTFKPEVQEEGLEQESSGWLYNKLLFDCLLHTSAVLMRAELVKKVGFFDPSLRKGQDYDYWVRVSRLVEIHKLNALLSLYRIHDQSNTHHQFKQNYRYILIKRAIDRWGLVGPDGTRTKKSRIRQMFADVWMGYGIGHFQYGERSIALKAFFNCILQQPLWYRGWLYFGVTLLGVRK